MVLSLNSPKRTSRVQTGPQDIGASLAFGVNLALFILQCTCSEHFETNQIATKERFQQYLTTIQVLEVQVNGKKI